MARLPKDRPRCPIQGKICFSTEAQAKSWRTRVVKKPGAEYKCRFCKRWHFTTKSKGMIGR